MQKEMLVIGSQPNLFWRFIHYFFGSSVDMEMAAALLSKLGKENIIGGSEPSILPDPKE